MRLKEFIIFLVIFTIIYIILCKIYDYFNKQKINNKGKNNLKKILNDNKYDIFINFYNINKKAENKDIIQIYNKLNNNQNININTLNNNLESNEIITIILFLEYYNLITKRNINMETGNISIINQNDLNILNKYNYDLSNKENFDTISKKLGQNTKTELEYLNNKYLLPGIKFIDSKIYYIGE